MFRRRSTDDEALAEAFRRLDGAGASSATVAATTLAEAERIDAALRTLLQPVAAPDTLAGRVAGEVGRARLARLRRGSAAARRPVWAMAFAGAAVVALVFGAALATAGQGGTIGERARGVGEWVRALLGVGVRGDGEDGVGDDDGVAPVGESDAAYYWVPGMGILPLEPETMVSTGPVTVTIGSRAPRFSIVQLIADHNGTWLKVRAERPYLVGAAAFNFAFEALDGETDSDDSGISVVLDGNGEGTVQLPGMHVAPDGRSMRLIVRDAAAPPVSIDVPVQPAATSRRRARRIGGDVTVGGLTLRAWGADVGPGTIAIRVEPSSDHNTDLITFGVGPDALENTGIRPVNPYAFLQYRPLGEERFLQPSLLFALVERTRVMGNGEYRTQVPRGYPLPTARFTSHSWTVVELPMTALFEVGEGRSLAGGALALSNLEWFVDQRLDPHSAELRRFDHATYRLRLARRPVVPVGTGAAVGGSYVMDPPETFEIGADVTLLGERLTLLKGLLKQFAAGRGLMLYVQPHPLPVRQWMRLEVGHVDILDRDDGRKPYCSVLGAALFYSDGPWGANPSGPNRTVASDLKSVELCFIRPLLYVPGPWTFR